MRGRWNGLMGVVAGALAVGAILLWDSKRRSQLEVFADTLTKSVDTLMASARDIIAPPPYVDPTPMQWAGRLVDGEGHEVSANGRASHPSQGPGPVPWFLDGTMGVEDDKDYDPTTLDAPLDRVVPMQAGSIGPVIETQHHTFPEPMPEGEFSRDARTIGYTPDDQPLSDIGLDVPPSLSPDERTRDE